MEISCWDSGCVAGVVVKGGIYCPASSPPSTLENTAGAGTARTGSQYLGDSRPEEEEEGECLW